VRREQQDGCLSLVASGSSPGTRSSFTRRPARRPRREHQQRIGAPSHAAAQTLSVCRARGGTAPQRLPPTVPAVQPAASSEQRPHRAAVDGWMAGWLDGWTAGWRWTRRSTRLHVYTYMDGDVRSATHAAAPARTRDPACPALKQLGNWEASPPSPAFYLWAVPPSGPPPAPACKLRGAPWAPERRHLYAVRRRPPTTSPFSCAGL
jgi:hypothetical protein